MLGLYEQIISDELMKRHNNQMPGDRDKDDAYKDDFSSDEEDKKRETNYATSDKVAINRQTNTTTIDLVSSQPTKSNGLSYLDIAEAVFDNSIRDNFQMQEATDTMRKSKFRSRFE